MSEKPFSNREIKLMLGEIKNTLIEHAETHHEILEQVKYTNGKVRKLYLYLTVVGSVTGTLLTINGSALAQFVIALL